jgi:hypothetical protein
VADLPIGRGHRFLRQRPQTLWPLQRSATQGTASLVFCDASCHPARMKRVVGGLILILGILLAIYPIGYLFGVLGRAMQAKPVRLSTLRPWSVVCLSVAH